MRVYYASLDSHNTLWAVVKRSLLIIADSVVGYKVYRAAAAANDDDDNARLNGIDCNSHDRYFAFLLSTHTIQRRLACRLGRKL